MERPLDVDHIIPRSRGGLSLFHLLFHERAKCQSLTGGNYNGYLRDISGDKASEELRLLRTIHICRHSTCCHCCSDDVIVGREPEFGPKDKFVVTPGAVVVPVALMSKLLFCIICMVHRLPSERLPL